MENVKSQEVEQRTFKLENLKVDMLQIDHQYQRALINSATVAKITQNFSWSAFGALSVMRRGGVHYVCDGQHRLLAAKKLGLVKVPCIVHESKGMEDEAATFVDINSTRSTVKAMDLYKSRLAKKEPLYLEIQAMLDELGLCATTCGKTKGGICFIDRILRSFPRDKVRCATAVQLSMAVCGDDPMHHYLFDGFWTLLFHEVPVEGHVDRLVRAGGQPVVNAAIRRATARGGYPHVSYLTCAQGIIDVINKNLRRNKLRLPKCD